MPARPTADSNASGQTPEPSRACTPVLVGPEMRLAAASRLVGDHADDPLDAGRRFLESAQTLRIDLSAMVAVLDPTGVNVLEVALGIIGAGRTAMVFVSGPARRHAAWFAAGLSRAAPATAQDHARRVACVEHLCHLLATRTPGEVVLAQALLEPEQREHAAALRDSGFQQLGDLAYMRRPLRAPTAPPPAAPDLGPTSPTGPLRVEAYDALAARLGADAAQDALAEALERSYIETRDCPELCGLRAVQDVLKSHRSVGVYDPRSWWVLLEGDEPRGCMLFSRCPEQDSVELVYMGLDPGVRGRGIGKALLAWGLEQVAHLGFRAGLGSVPGPDRLRGGSLREDAEPFAGSGGVTCAVDTRNPAAVRLYRRLGFQRFATRLPLVRRVSVQEA